MSGQYADCKALFKDGKEAVINCDTKTGVYQTSLGVEVTCVEFQTVCGDVKDVISIGEGVDVDCDSVDGNDYCAFQCAGDDVPYPLEGVTCDSKTETWSQTSGSVRCADTKCGDTKDFLYGSEWKDMTASCSYNEFSDVSSCNLDCELDNRGGKYKGTPLPVSVVACNKKNLLPPIGNNIIFADTPCGKHADSDTINVISGISYTCDASGCDMACSSGLMPSYKSVSCKDSQYETIAKTIDCGPQKDSPCGNVKDEFTIASGVQFTCDSFNSIYQTSTSLCDITCTDASLVVVGSNKLVCSNNKFTSRPSNTIACAKTQCGNPEDKWAMSGAPVSSAPETLVKLSVLTTVTLRL